MKSDALAAHRLIPQELGMPLKNRIQDFTSDIKSMLNDVKQAFNDFFGQNGMSENQNFSFQFQYTSLSITQGYPAGGELESKLNQEQSLLDKIERLIEKAQEALSHDACECGQKSSFNDILYERFDMAMDSREKDRSFSFEVSYQKLQMKHEGSLWMESD